MYFSLFSSSRLVVLVLTILYVGGSKGERESVNKHQVLPGCRAYEYGLMQDGTIEPVSRDQFHGREQRRANNQFPLLS